MAVGDPLRFRRAVEELLAELLDEQLPVGELCRFVDSARETVADEDKGIDVAPFGAAARMSQQVARTLAERLDLPFEREARRVLTEDEREDDE